ncbi:lipid-A-disaccharide synthase [Wenyingzhuangia sp. 2_MG-2023]|uniref:lipid-A-disaccharide synthase n=1 Tax=Wenyingzhuangia sp. 2_MG-2023 TaxID=3062639 RepID=UPI0026E28A7A|nr:lipid-A-disaccharide synthase [Wenyingzhuangia sp. 2_MG-2023]MDO6738236.1 lipid-A-disaccharide synthase [Wenyingzhuangia sp. 2_MG-2023]
MKYYLIAGEASGDLHASNLMKSLLEKDPQAEFRFFGGDLMQSVGGTLVKHYRELAFMGVLEVLKNIRTIFKNIDFCKKDLIAFQPDMLILIDYPGFNLRIAEFAKKNGIKVHYYISPKIWAWKESRIHKIKRDVDQMHVIFPFEIDYYENKHHFPVNYVGNPLLDAIHQRAKVVESDFRKEHHLGIKPIIALLPGSRTQEITKILSVMLSVVDVFKEYQFVIAGAPSKSDEFYEQFIGSSNVKFINNKTYDLLSISTAALVTSGTATLETALFKVPQVVCYKTSGLTYYIASKLVKLNYISLVNLVMDREVVKELIQQECNQQQLTKELQLILSEKGRVKMLSDYKELHEKLGGVGASEKLANSILGH